MSRRVVTKKGVKILRDDLFAKLKGRVYIATARDLPDLFTLEEKSFDPAFYDPMLPASMRHMIRAGNGVMIAARGKDDALLGYALVLFRKDSFKARLGSVAVDPERRGAGTGSVLLQAAALAAKAAGAQSILLESRADMGAHLRLYEKNGYKTIRIEKKYFPDGTAAHKMRCDL